MKTPLHMVHSSFLLIFGTQDPVFQVSGLTAENSVFALFALETVPTRKGNKNILSDITGAELLMKFMLSLLIFILSHGKCPSKSTAIDKAWNRRACKPKKASSDQEDLCDRIVQCPVEDCVRQAGVCRGRRRIVCQCPSTLFKRQAVLYCNDLIHSSKLDLDMKYFKHILLR